MSLSMYMVHQSFWQMTTQLQNSLKFSPSRITSYMIYGSSMYCAYSSKLFLSHNLIIIIIVIFIIIGRILIWLKVF